MCVAHASHRVFETIRVLYPNVDKLVANGKKIFVKSPARIEFLKNKAPDTLQERHVREPDWMPLCIMQKTFKSSVMW
jgi:hypothetical protein